MSKAVPAYLGHYRLLTIIHNGHGCQLWKASDERKKSLVAIKFPQGDGKSYRNHVAQLRREWEVLTSAVHDRIIAAFEFCTDREVPFLVIEWDPAPNMKNRIRQGFEAIAPRVPTIVLQTSEAVAFLHSKGWIHRDIKPENFLVDDSGQVKLIDFALALRKPGFLSKLLNLGGKLQGTRTYMSPEQIRGKVLDERSDLYSLACTLYELVAGKPPFVGNSPNELLTKHLKAPPPPLESVNPRATAEFSQLLRRAMAKEPAQRPKSVQEFWRELQGMAVLRRGAASAG